MARAQHRSKRKVTGGRYRTSRTKRKYELSRYSANTKVDPECRKQVLRILGGNAKTSLLTASEMNVTNKEGKAVKTQIVTVVENPANPNLVRRNIITRGAVVETKLGRVKVTSRPGQEGTLNGVLV